MLENIGVIHMATISLRVPEPGEVWFNKNNWGANFITETGRISFNQGDEQYPSLLIELGCLGNSQGGKSPPVFFEKDGWTVFNSYSEFIEHRRTVMLQRLQDTIRKVNEACDRETKQNRPGTFF
jgi:hypothetical protein